MKGIPSVSRLRRSRPESTRIDGPSAKHMFSFHAALRFHWLSTPMLSWPRNPSAKTDCSPATGSTLQVRTHRTKRRNLLEQDGPHGAAFTRPCSAFTESPSLHRLSQDMASHERKVRKLRRKKHEKLPATRMWRPF